MTPLLLNPGRAAAYSLVLPATGLAEWPDLPGDLTELPEPAGFIAGCSSPTRLSRCMRNGQ